MDSTKIFLFQPWSKAKEEGEGEIKEDTLKV